MTESMHPELAAATVADPPDAVAVTYRAAADVLNGGTHAARVGYEPRPVDDARLTVRTEALDETAQALMIAVAVLRDASAETRPELTTLLQRATEAAWDAGAALTDVGRLLAGPTAADYDDDDDEQ